MGVVGVVVDKGKEHQRQAGIMKWKNTDPRTILNIISAIILLVGLGSAILIYRTAENVPAGVLGYEQGDRRCLSGHA